MSSFENSLQKSRKYNILYQLTPDTFYQVAATSSSIKKAADKLGVSESTLKWFLYQAYEIRDEDLFEKRRERVAAYFDGQTVYKKRTFLYMEIE